MKHIIYIHGFASSGKSPKSDALAAAFPDAIVHNDTYEFDPIGTMDRLSNLIKSLASSTSTEQIILVGTSLGGFYARILSARFDVPAILMNPLIDPSSTQSITVGIHKDYSTGDNFEVFEQDIDELIQMNETYTPDMENIHYFANADDDVISANVGLAYFKYAKTQKVFTDGGHRFNQIERVFPTISSLIDR